MNARTGSDQVGPEGLDQLLDGIYAAALAPGDMPFAMVRAATALGYDAAGFVVSPHGQDNRRCLAACGLDADICERAERTYDVSRLASIRAGSGMQPGAIHHSEDLFAQGELAREPYYHEFVKPHGLADGVMVCLERTGERQTVLNLARPLHPRDSRAARGQRLRQVVPHLVRALRIRAHGARTDHVRDACTGLTDTLPFGVVTLDACGQVFSLNRRATSILQGGGLGMERGGLRACNPPDNERLAACLAEALAAASGVPRALRAADLLIGRRSGRRALQLTVVALPAARDTSGRCPAVAIYIHDPEVHGAPPVQRIRELFGLTRAEAAVAQGIMRGLTVDECAAENSQARTTARNLLKRVFAKTGTRRQSELAVLMLRSTLVVGTEPMCDSEST
jgi:DNA-binding CsgD family transcriptional regulator